MGVMCIYTHIQDRSTSEKSDSDREVEVEVSTPEKPSSDRELEETAPHSVESGVEKVSPAYGCEVEKGPAPNSDSYRMNVPPAHGEGEWTTYTDATTGQQYEYNTTTAETRWLAERPQQTETFV